MEEVLIDWAVVSGAAVVLAFVINQAAAWLGYSASDNVRKGVAFSASFALAGYFALQGDLGIPDFDADPVAFAFALMGASVLVYKAAQQIYDRLWQGLLDA